MKSVLVAVMRSSLLLLGFNLLTRRIADSVLRISSEHNGRGCNAQQVLCLSSLSIQLFQLNFTTIFVIASVIFCRHYVARVAVRGSGGNLSCSYFFVNTYVIFGSLSLYIGRFLFLSFRLLPNKVYRVIRYGYSHT